MVNVGYTNVLSLNLNLQDVSILLTLASQCMAV